VTAPVPTVFLRPAEAAKYLGISKRYLATLARNGTVRPCRLSRRVTLYAVADLDAAVLRLREPGAP
jgi:excisionase family DNA binding protein